MSTEQPRMGTWTYLYPDLGGGPVEVRMHFDHSATAEGLLDVGEFYTFQGSGPAHPDRQKAREQNLTLNEGGGEAGMALLHTAARGHDTTVGRWLGEDPAGFASEGGDLHRYSGGPDDLPSPPN